MSLSIHRSQRTERLLEGLAALVRTTASADPLEELPIVVGSRGMERWLRHELATELDAALGLAFPMVGAALDASLRWLLAGADEAVGPFWERPREGVSLWTGERFVGRVRALLREELEAPEFAHVATYLAALRADRTRPVDAREEGFSREVAEVLERLLYDRPLEALDWVRGGVSPPAEHAWLALALRRLHETCDELSPAALVEAALAVRATPRLVPRTLAVFGLSTLRPGDKLRLGVLARHLDVHLYALTPSSTWWSHVKSRREAARALARVRGDTERSALLAELERQNPILAASGIPSRDLQIWAEEIDAIDSDPIEARDDDDPSLLGRLQRWLDEADDVPEPGAWAEHAACDSIRIHATHGPLRACEALRDDLLARFAKDSTLEPRHVVVMTPDLESYAPLVAAVFQRGGHDGSRGGGPSIPVSVADLGLRTTNPVADVLVRVLDLVSDRVSAGTLFELFALEAVRARFGIAEDELSRLERLLASSAMRWGWDAEDRAEQGQRRSPHHTVAFGLERLALGVLMPDPGGFEVVRTPTGEGPPLVPVDVVGRDDVGLFGKLAAACARLEELRRGLGRAAPLADWRERLRRLVRDLTDTPPERAWQRVEVERTLDELFFDEGDDAPRYDLSAVRALVTGAFEMPARGGRAASDAVTVCALEPMRSVPFRIVVLLGMDDGVFPRSAKVPRWSPFHAPRFGESDRRAIDRHMFLEAVLSARDALLVYGTGFEPKQAKRVPLAAVVGELDEVISRALGRERAIEVSHPLHPWSPRCFEQGEARSFDARWLEAADRLRRGALGRCSSPDATAFDPIAWPPSVVVGDEVLSAESLVDALTRPQRELLHVVLGLPRDRRLTDLEEREPLELDSASRKSLLARVLRLVLDGAELRDAALAERLRAEGELPPGVLGRDAIRDAVASCRSLKDRVDSLVGGPGGEVRFACELAIGARRRVVTATAPLTRSTPDGHWLLWCVPRKTPYDAELLLAWVSLLVGCLDPAAPERLRGAAIVCEEATKGVALLAPEAPEVVLAELLRVRDEVRSGPVPLFPRLSRSIEEERRRPQSPKGLREAVELAVNNLWLTTTASGHPGVLRDEWTSLLFADVSPEELLQRCEALASVAARVWEPYESARTTFARGGLSTPAKTRRKGGKS